MNEPEPFGTVKAYKILGTLTIGLLVFAAGGNLPGIAAGITGGYLITYGLHWMGYAASKNVRREK